MKQLHMPPWHPTRLIQSSWNRLRRVRRPSLPASGLHLDVGPQQNDCLAYIDLTDVGRCQYCPNCRNLSLYSHGPVHHPSTTDYESLMYTGHAARYFWLNRAVLEESAFGSSPLSPGSPPLSSSSSLPCQYCRLLFECAVRLTPWNGEKQMPQFLGCSIILTPGSDVIMQVFGREPDPISIQLSPYHAPTSEHLREDTHTAESLESTSPRADVRMEYPFEDQGLPRRRLPSYCGSDTMAFFRRCMDRCMAEHALCNERISTELPTRLLHLDAVGEIARLVETRDLAGEPPPYAAFSYCWGGSAQRITLQTDSVNDLKGGVNLKVLPAVFRDAVSVALQMGVEYLWIDALTIIQDDHKDWVVESGRMLSIYENARFVINANRSHHPEVSFLGPLATYDDSFVRFVISNADGIPCRTDARKVTARELWPDLSDGSTSRRAWCLQESILATKCLNFGAGEAWWRCKEFILNETRDDSRPVLRLWQLAADSPDETWMKIISVYSSREITRWSDRLPALSGLASWFRDIVWGHAGSKASVQKQHQIPSYCAGLWLPGLDYWPQLSWIIAETKYDETSTTWLEADFAAPSWSWASVKGEVAWETRSKGFGGDHVPRARFIRASCTPSSSANPYGGVERRSCCLVLSGPTVWADVVCPVAGSCFIRWKEDGAPPADAHFDTKLALHTCNEEDFFEQDDEKEGRQQFSVSRARFAAECADLNGSKVRVKCLMLWTTSSSYFLMMLGRPRESAFKGAYERLGIVMGQDGRYPLVFERVGKEEIIIV